MAHMMLRLLGTPRCEIDGTPVELRRRKVIALLAYLAVTQQRHSRDRLAELLYERSERERAGANLRHVLTLLRRAIGSERIGSNRHYVWLEHPDAVGVDVVEFRRLVRLATREPHQAHDAGVPTVLERAVELYHGEFLSGFFLSDAVAFEQWQASTEEDLRTAQADALLCLIALLTARREYPRAVEFAYRRLLLDPLDEARHRQLMQLLYLDGRRSEALRHFDRLRTVIGRTEAAGPEDETVRLRDEIARAAHLTPSSNPNTHVGLAAYYDTRGRMRRRVLLTARLDCSSDEAHAKLVATLSNAAQVVLDDFELSFCAFFRDVNQAVDVVLEAVASASTLDGTVRAAILGVEHANQCVPSERLMERAAALVQAASPGNVLLDESVVDLVLQEHVPEPVMSIDLGPIQLADLQLPRRVRLLSVDPRPAMPHSLGDVPNNLPRQSTAFVGRRRDVSMLREQLVSPDTRVLTLTGVGGVGKTRLALHVAAAASEHFSDGIYFVDLVPTKNVVGVIASIASRLQLPHRQSRGDGVLRKLCDRIGQKKMLLLLDNLEHIRGAARCVLSLLADCVNLTLLVTTREPLHIQPEHIVAVPPLSLPGPPENPRAARTSEAVELFLDRARAAGASFSLDEDNLTAIGEVCRRLDGLPLAIELVAARSTALTPPALLALIARGLRVARSESPDIPERQRSLEREVAWSYGLLEPAEQTVFRRSAIFPDTWTLQSISTVCTLDGESVDVSSIVFSLAAKNMVSAIPDGSTARFRLLNTLRAFALERLRESGEEQSLLRRLADYDSHSGAATTEGT